MHLAPRTIVASPPSRPLHPTHWPRTHPVRALAVVVALAALGFAALTLTPSRLGVRLDGGPGVGLAAAHAATPSKAAMAPGAALADVLVRTGNRWDFLTFRDAYGVGDTTPVSVTVRAQSQVGPYTVAAMDVRTGDAPGQPAGQDDDGAEPEDVPLGLAPVRVRKGAQVWELPCASARPDAVPRDKRALRRALRKCKRRLTPRSKAGKRAARRLKCTPAGCWLARYEARVRPARRPGGFSTASHTWWAPGVGLLAHAQAEASTETGDGGTDFLVLARFTPGAGTVAAAPAAPRALSPEPQDAAAERARVHALAGAKDLAKLAKRAGPGWTEIQVRARDLQGALDPDGEPQPELVATLAAATARPCQLVALGSPAEHLLVCPAQLAARVAQGAPLTPAAQTAKPAETTKPERAASPRAISTIEGAIFRRSVKSTRRAGRARGPRGGSSDARGPWRLVTVLHGTPPFTWD